MWVKMWATKIKGNLKEKKMWNENWLFLTVGVCCKLSKALFCVCVRGSSEENSIFILN